MKKKKGLPAGRQVEFKIGKETLRGSLFIPKEKGPFPAVIFYHGRRGSKNRYLPISERLSEKGVMVLAYDFRGNGESDGKFEDKTNRTGIEDAQAGLNFLLKQNVDKERIGIAGTSFGAYCVVMTLGSNHFVKSVIIRAPAAYNDKLMDLKVAENDVDGNFKDSSWEKSKAFEYIRGFKGELLVIECEKDEVIPPEIVLKYFNEAKKARRKELKIIKGADHAVFNSGALEAFHDLIFDWFTRTL